MNNLSSLVNLVRIADESLVHHFAGTSKRRNNEHTRWRVDLTSDKFLSYEIHTVAKWCDQTNHRIAIESRQFVLADATVNVSYGRPVGSRKTTVDAAN